MQTARQSLEPFEAMAQQGLAPNVITYMALLSACEQGKQPERALVVFAATVQ